jgi:hypothetical protein
LALGCLRLAKRPGNIDNEKLIGAKPARECVNREEIGKVDVEQIPHSPKAVAVDFDRPFPVGVVFE